MCRSVTRSLLPDTTGRSRLPKRGFSSKTESETIPTYIQQTQPTDVLVVREMAFNPQTSMNINQMLPPEILDKILSYFSIEEKIESCEGVCSQWQRMVHHSIQSLAFRKTVDVFHGFHEHAVEPKTRVYHKTEDEKVSCIINNYGRNLRMFQGLCINRQVVCDLARVAKFLHCIDTEINDSETLNILGETFGNQLTCVTLHFKNSGDVAPFLLKCSKLTSLATILHRDANGVTPNRVVNFFDLSTLNPKPLMFAKSLRNLTVGGYVTEIMLQHLKMFTNLEMFCIVLHSEIDHHRE